MRLRRYGLAAGAAVIAAIVGLALAYPAAAAVACPGCFGFEPLAGHAYMEGPPAATTRSDVQSLVAAAENRVRDFYGERESDPRIFVCATESCYRRVGGGGSRGMAMIDAALFVSPRGANVVIVSHELSHIELHHRLGLIRTVRRDIPQWFDEGLAVNVSDDPRYLAPRAKGDRCLVESDEVLPADRRAWIETAASHDLYAKAACRVSRWLAANGGSKALVGLIGRVKAGVPFEVAYRQPLG